MFCLRIFEPGLGHRVVPLHESVITGGAGPDNEIRLGMPKMPGVAFRLSAQEGGFEFSSASSQGKTLVNGKKCDSALLVPGDRVEVAGAILILDHAHENAPGLPERDPLGGISRLCSLVAEERDLNTLLKKILDLSLETFTGNEAFLFTLDAQGQPNIFVGSGGKESSPQLFSDTVVTKVLRERKGLFIANTLSSPEFSNAASISVLKLRSVMCCPIAAAGKISGLLYVGSNRPSVSYSEADLRELEIHSLVAGCLINHVGYIAMQDKLLASLRDPGAKGMIAAGPRMLAMKKEADAVAASDISVLLLGETGTGKDVLAHFIHRRSLRSDRPFLVINCSTLRGELLASELFGHKKGSFTGALRDEPGMFVTAHGGTLFLDEVAELELPLQAMLLRALENGAIRPVGQMAEIKTDVRILCATNRDLEERVAAGQFRQDLYYRINQHQIALPPLRERGEDILVLAHHFLEKAKAQYPEKRIEGFHPESLFAMARYSWPGNVRELANAVQKAVLFANTPAVWVAFPSKAGAWVDFDEATRRFQADYLQKALALCDGDKEKAADMLGMGRSTFFRYLAQAKNDGKGPAGPA